MYYSRMFDLERAISEWRRDMLAAGIKDLSVLDELECHLREDLARQVESGESMEGAFEAAMPRVGDPRLLRSEFAKVGEEKGVLLRRLRGIIIRYFVPFPSLDTFYLKCAAGFGVGSVGGPAASS